MSQLLFESFQPLAAIATTPTAARILYPLCQSTGATLWLPRSCQFPELVRTYDGSLKDHLASVWQDYRGFIFSLATGAVVRSIAPLLQDKSRDPAVVVVDPTGNFVISLCSGHQGGADELTRAIAHQLGATPILTSASASLGVPGIDILGVPFGWRRGTGDWTGVSAAIAKGERVEILQEVGSTLWQDRLPETHSFAFGFPESNEAIAPKGRIWISATQRQFAPDGNFPKVQWHPRVLWVGIGCVRGTVKQTIAQAIETVFQRHHLALDAIAGIATIDLKADEVGLLEYCRDRDLPLKTYSAEELKLVEVPNPSAVVAEEVGTPSVAEAAAIQASDSSLLVAKQVWKDEGGAVTVAIARSDLEYTGRTGRLWLVGIGPGNLDQVTPAAKTAIARSDAIIGYSLYIDLIDSLLRAGQIVESSPITQERQRAQRAIELARWGLTVAVVSSGDCGIYGMAGLVLEELQQAGWDGKNPQVEVFPGITALQAAAARVGAPLMHDFCAISLSDLLTPWEAIEKRLTAAAMGDFVTAFYNPRSQQRVQPLITAREIFLQYRDPLTPVALVRAAYRRDERIVLTNLDEMLKFPIDMLTTVIIGNRSTCHYRDRLITPRGYLQR